MDGFYGLFAAGDYYPGRGLSPEEVEEQLTRRADQARGRCASPRPQDLGRPRPFQVEPHAAQPPCEEPPRRADVPPQGFVQRGVVRPWMKSVGSAYILLVNEQLVEVRDAPHPPDPKEALWRSGPDGLDECGLVRRSEMLTMSFCIASPCTGQHKPRAGGVAVLANNEVIREVARRPGFENRRRLGSELVQEIAEPFAFDGVQAQVHHSLSSPRTRDCSPEVAVPVRTAITIATAPTARAAVSSAQCDDSERAAMALARTTVAWAAPIPERMPSERNAGLGIARATRTLRVDNTVSHK